MSVSNFISQVVGGGVVGGFLGSLVIRRLDTNSKRDLLDKEVKGALKLIDYELTICITTVSIFLEKKCKSKPGPIRDEAYRSVQKLLATELGNSDMMKLAAIYESLPVFKENMEDLYNTGKMVKSYIDSLDFFLTKLREGQKLVKTLTSL